MPVEKTYLSDNPPHNMNRILLKKIWEETGIAVEIRDGKTNQLLEVVCFTHDTASELAQDLFCMTAEIADVNKPKKSEPKNEDTFPS